MDQLLHALRTFFDHLAAIGWGAIAVAVALHLAKTAARTRAWRNVVAAAYPATSVRWRSVFGAYAAGVAANTLVPARGGDLLKLHLLKQRVVGASYVTLGATLLVETLFDVAIALALVAWALSLGVLPGLDALPRLPSIDWLWLAQNPRWGAALIGAALALAAIAATWALRRVGAFRARVARGFTILREPRRYAREVVAWQALEWSLRLATLYVLLRAFGVEATLHNALLVQVSQSLATILPLTPSGIGTEQALVVYVLAGKASTTALLSFSVGMKIVLMAVNVTLGLVAIALMLRTLRWRRAIDGRLEPTA